MNKKYFVAITVFAVMLMALTVISVYSQEDVKFVKDSAFTDTMRPAVRFDHEQHNEKAEIEDCNYCHHTYNDKAKVEDESSEDKECSECHMADGKGNPASLARVYHITCKECHEQAGKGPVMCAECHNKAAAGALGE